MLPNTLPFCPGTDPGRGVTLSSAPAHCSFQRPPSPLAVLAGMTPG